MPDHVDEMLVNGKSTGAVLLQTPGGECKLQVRRGQRGRGLFAARPVDKGEVIATIYGNYATAAVPGFESWQVAKKKHFVMEPCSRQHLGILANTAAGISRNNARYVVPRTNTNIMRLLAIRRISAGEEILVCYGCGYVAKMTKKIEEKRISQHAAAKKAELTAPIRIRAGAARVIICAKCGKRVTQSIRFSHARMCRGTFPVL